MEQFSVAITEMSQINKALQLRVIKVLLHIQTTHLVLINRTNYSFACGLRNRTTSIFVTETLN